MIHIGLELGKLGVVGDATNIPRYDIKLEISVESYPLRSETGEEWR